MEALSMKSGVAMSTIDGWERDYVVPTTTLLCCIADALEVSLDKLIGRTPPNSDGVWKKNEKGIPYCSKCGALPLYKKCGDKMQRFRTPHCPRCGAKMQEDTI